MTFLCHVISTKSHDVASTYFAVFTLYAQPSAERTQGQAMSLDLFSRKLVLLVEDEPLIALNVEHHLRKAGARVITAGYLDSALSMTEHPDLSGAVIDLCLGAESATPIFQRLTDRNPHWLCHRCPAARLALDPVHPETGFTGRNYRRPRAVSLGRALACFRRYPRSAHDHRHLIHRPIVLAELGH
jgi:hypothetical protein